MIKKINVKTFVPNSWERLKIDIDIAIALFITRIHTIKYKEQKCSYQKDAISLNKKKKLKHGFKYLINKIMACNEVKFWGFYMHSRTLVEECGTSFSLTWRPLRE
jgi:hypothetical protein